ncbi:MAG: BREX-2 system adenine-specific DNA-methyltransferase PglX [Myxococcota bacterium]
MPLTTEARADLLAALQPHVAAIAEDLRARLVDPSTRAEVAARMAATRLHAEEAVGEALNVWLDLLGRRAAVLWVLKFVYVRVLEDRALIGPRLIDPTHQQLFERIAPSLGDTAFVRWVFIDLARPEGGLPELFATEPAEVLAPQDTHTRALLALFREADKDTRVRRFDFTGERFEGQLLGDLYQELDPVVKERYALLQTPSFVRSFMLDRTLGEALKEWPADEIRVLDPACGSGHFLIDALRRLVDATAAQHPDWPMPKVVRSALPRVVGIDLNDYAAALARARLVMTALELSGEGRLRAASDLQPNVFWADGLEQVERGESLRGTPIGLFDRPGDTPTATLTPEATREALRPVLEPRFHVVVANPPYIVEGDEARKKYHREAVGRPKRPRYVSAYREYGLGAPFTERCFQLAIRAGFVGLINGSAFTKREYGVPLVEEVLTSHDLTLLVDTSGAYIPGHGTPTIMIFGRNRSPSSEHFVAVLGKRGEPSNPDDGTKGKVWQSIVAGWHRPGFDSPFVSTEWVERAKFSVHPWSLRGGGALALQTRLQDGATRLAEVAQATGFMLIAGLDPVFLREKGAYARRGVSRTRPLFIGEGMLAWQGTAALECAWPMSESVAPLPETEVQDVICELWRYRTSLRDRKLFGKPIESKGKAWWELREVYAERIGGSLTIACRLIATHNDFLLDRTGAVFKNSAPVIKLPSGATEADHLALLGPLNSSVACFWMKQTFFCKGSSSGDTIRSEDWEPFWEFDSTKLARFPLPPNRESTVPWARALDALGSDRAADTVAASLAEPSWRDAKALRALLDTRRTRDLARLRRMVGLQEELDWLAYRLYGLVPAELPVLAPDDTPAVTPGHRPFELDLAVRDAAIHAALARGETPDDTPTAWFSRHNWTASTTLPADAPPTWADLVARRRAITAATAHLQLLEAPVHKRRWYNPDFKEDEEKALREFLLDKLEASLSPLGAPTTPRALARRLAADARFVAAAVLLTGSEAPDLGALAAELMAKEAVAAHPAHRYTAKGLIKRREWEATWDLQAKEDRGEKVGKIKVPPKYTGVDFVGGTAYPLRGPLDVPKERFVAHTEIPTVDGKRRAAEDSLYGWAGWTRADRLARLFALLEELDDEGAAPAQRVALHDLMFRYADELARTEPGRAADLRADLKGEAGPPPTAAQLGDWLKTHPPTKAW